MKGYLPASQQALIMRAWRSSTGMVCGHSCVMEALVRRKYAVWNSPLRLSIRLTDAGQRFATKGELIAA